MLRVPAPWILSLTLALFPGFAAQAFDLGDLMKKIEDTSKDLGTSLNQVDQMRGKVSRDEEIEIGGNLASGLLGAAPLVDDPQLQRYVNDVGFWVASQSKRKNLPWRFGVIQSNGINAFAAPGGYILVTMGLYQLLENEAQLATVLAHEIAHVVRKHHLKALQKTMKREFWSELTVDVVDDRQDRDNVRMLIGSGLKLYTTGLDRKYEFDADLRGVVLAARAGYDPYAFLDVLTTIDSINPGSPELTVLLNTHPASAERLDQLAGQMDGKLDSYAAGAINANRFREIAAGR
jgi:predicted Zn-dependent protease